MLLSYQSYFKEIVNKNRKFIILTPTIPLNGKKFYTHSYIRKIPKRYTTQFQGTNQIELPTAWMLQSMRT